MLKGPDRSMVTSEKYKQFIVARTCDRKMTRREDEAGIWNRKDNPGGPDH